MLEEIYMKDDGLSEDDYYDALFYLIGDAYPDLYDDEIEDFIEDMLDQMPGNYAESILGTVGNLGKSIGSGVLQFSAQNPELVKAAGLAAGTAVGGPAGATIGTAAGNYLVSAGTAKYLPKTGQTLSLMQNPQAQAAVTRATMGVGNGTAPFTQNGVTNLIPVATYLRAIISSAQEALKELDKYNIIPPAQLSESMPYAEDIDLQADWLIEQLTK